MKTTFCYVDAPTTFQSHNGHENLKNSKDQDRTLWLCYDMQQKHHHTQDSWISKKSLSRLNISILSCPHSNSTFRPGQVSTFSSKQTSQVSITPISYSWTKTWLYYYAPTPKATLITIHDITTTHSFSFPFLSSKMPQHVKHRPLYNPRGAFKFPGPATHSGASIKRYNNSFLLFLPLL